MKDLDAHYSALWISNERRLDEQNRPQKFTVTVAVEGYVEVEVEATSRTEAVEQALAKVDERDWDIVVTDKFFTDVEESK